MTTYKRKIGLNRGKPRLWLEGKILADNGFTHRVSWDAIPVVTSYGHTLSLIAVRDGRRYVAGTVDRPIIDINSTALLAGLDGEVEVEVCEPGFIKVRKA